MEMLSDFPNENYKLPHRVRSQIRFDHQAIGRNGKGPTNLFLFLHQVYEAMKEQVFYGIEAYMARKKVEFNQLQPRSTYFRTRSSKAETLASWRFWRRTPTTSIRTRSKSDLAHTASTSCLIKTLSIVPHSTQIYRVILARDVQQLTVNSARRAADPLLWPEPTQTGS